MNNKLLKDAKASGFVIKEDRHNVAIDFSKETGVSLYDKLTRFAEEYHVAKCAEGEPINSQLCGCGKLVRYSTYSGMACNKIARCSTREELESKVIELTLQVTKAESEPVAYRQTIHCEQKGEVKIQYGYSEIQIMVSDTPLYAKPQAIDAAMIGKK